MPAVDAQRREEWAWPASASASTSAAGTRSGRSARPRRARAKHAPAGDRRQHRRRARAAHRRRSPRRPDADDGTARRAATPRSRTAAAPPPNAAEVPDPSLAQNRTWTGDISLSQGDLGIELDGAAAPQAVANFVTLAGKGFFDKTKCHRLTDGDGLYVLQCGDPEPAPAPAAPATPGARSRTRRPTASTPPARSPWPGQSNDGCSMGSQFFLVYKDSTIPADTAGGYTVFGHVTSGLDVVQAIADAGTTEGTQSRCPTSSSRE